MKRALEVLRDAGCNEIYLDGSFVTEKESPSDYDCCWMTAGVDLVKLISAHPVFINLSNRRAGQKAKYGGEFLPARGIERVSGKTFLDFFQIDKQLGTRKGIIQINLWTLP